MGKAPFFDFSINETDVKRIKEKLERASGKPLYQRMQKGTLAAGQLVAQHIRNATPRDTGKTGLKSKTRARLGRKRVGYGARGFQYSSGLMVLVGPTSPHRHLVIRGHRIVTPGGRYLGRRAIAQSYVEPFKGRFLEDAKARVRKEWAAALR